MTRSRASLWVSTERPLVPLIVRSTNTLSCRIEDAGMRLDELPA